MQMSVALDQKYRKGRNELRLRHHITGINQLRARHKFTKMLRNTCTKRIRKNISIHQHDGLPKLDTFDQLNDFEQELMGRKEDDLS